MSISTPAPAATPLSNLAENLIGSEIIKIGGQLNARIAAGDKIANLTIGDFDPKVFPLPDAYLEEILTAYREGHTNYPQANGMEPLRAAVSRHLARKQGLDYSKDEVLIASGGRPLIYAAFRTVVDPTDKVVFPIPSWNNNHYSFLTSGEQVAVQTSPDNRFLPTAEDLRPHLAGASLLAVCSPLNPTGTSFTADQLAAICDLVLEENARRGDRKPLYLLYDQIYSALTLGDTVHVDPVSLRPEMRPYTIFIDGVSKAFAATGVRVGWAFGPEHIMKRMHSLLGHIGAWAPKPEQIATARLLQQEAVVDGIIAEHLGKIQERVGALHEGFLALKQEGFPVDAIQAEGALYLTVKIDLQGRPMADGTVLNDAEEVTLFLIREARLGIVPFYAFGGDRKAPWFRVSVGTLRMEAVPTIFEDLRAALSPFVA
ncbi:Aspartate aminotransferase [Planctomycetes bacterium Poly30]|uniref:Aspartate aminotransferase n=1 Tax=Saltatorellus ferox TaxID=2528018 RepID=A0A518EZN4_9BACT|nr:Aspartate aminotransferase [Planctomycetes bacterium Poly30]